jgi:hypothetical protein
VTLDINGNNTNSNNNNSVSNGGSGGCLLNFNKESGKITVVKSGSNPTPITSIGNLNIHPFFHI